MHLVRQLQNALFVPDWKLSGAKLEAGGDVKLSTLQRYFAAIGEKFAVAV